MRTEEQIRQTIKQLEEEEAKIIESLNPLDSDIVKRNAKMAIFGCRNQVSALKWVLDE